MAIEDQGLRYYLDSSQDPDMEIILRLGGEIEDPAVYMMDNLTRLRYLSHKDRLIPAMAIAASFEHQTHATTFHATRDARTAFIVRSANRALANTMRLEGFKVFSSDTGRNRNISTVHGLRVLWGTNPSRRFRSQEGYPPTEFRYPDPTDLEIATL